MVLAIRNQNHCYLDLNMGLNHHGEVNVLIHMTEKFSQCGQNLWNVGCV